jgi:hypothetical protein
VVLEENGNLTDNLRVRIVQKIVEYLNEFKLKSLVNIKFE